MRRSANEERRVMLKKLEWMTVGAGVLPSGSRSGELDLDEVMYMRSIMSMLLVALTLSR